MDVRYDGSLDASDLSGLGPDLWPVTRDRITGLLADAWRCAVGDGPRTRVDVAVREAWEVRTLPGLDTAGWLGRLQPVLDAAEDALSFGGPVTARFDKLVLYGPEGHFAEHRDTLRADGHVGTLVVRLRSAAAGGRLWVGDRQPEADPDVDGVPVTVFHADVPHWVEPVEEGWRVTLVFQVHRAAAARPLGSEPAGATVPGLPTGYVPGGQVALLRHRYSRAALEAGALVGADRALAAAWRSEDPEVQLEVASLSGHLRHLQLDLVAHPVDGGEPEPVKPGPRMASFLREHRLGGFNGWTGNEGTVEAWRYHAALLVRRPGPPARLHPEVSEVLSLAASLAEERAAALEEHLPTLQASLDSLRDGTWLGDLRARVEQLSVAKATEAVQEAVTAWWEPGRDLHDRPGYSRTADLLERERAPSDTLFAQGAVEVAKQAVAEEWTSWDEEVWGPAPPEVVDGLRSWTVAREAFPDTAVPPGVRQLRMASWPRELEQLPTLPAVEELALLHCRYAGIVIDLARVPELRRLHWDGKVVGQPPDASQMPLFGTNDGGGVVQAVVSILGGELPPGLCTPNLRSLDVKAPYAGEHVRGLSALSETPGLRRLALRSVAHLHGLPWGGLPELTHLTLEGDRDQQVRLPAEAQARLEGLEGLVLRRADLSAVDLSRCRRLHTLVLDRCTGVGAPPPGDALRHLELDRTAMPIPRGLGRLEALVVRGVDDGLALVGALPRLRELELVSLRIADLGGLRMAPLRSLHLENLGALAVPTGWRLPELEALTLRKLPVGEAPAWGPNLRVLSVRDLPLAALPDDEVPELMEATLEELPLRELPAAWAGAPLTQLHLEDLDAFHALPGWLLRSGTLQRLVLVAANVTTLPALDALPALHELAWMDADRVLDDAAVAVLRAAPSLITVQLMPADDHENSDLTLPGQLWRAGWKPPKPEPLPVAERVDDGDDDDIPF